MAQLVLTVDDSQTTQDILRVTLIAAGYRVIQAADGAQALLLLDKERPDLIMTDLVMPVMDGIGFIGAVRQRREHRDTPILVVSSETDQGARLRAQQAGASGWLAKPVNPAGLVEELRRVLP